MLVTLLEKPNLTITLRIRVLRNFHSIQTEFNKANLNLNNLKKKPFNVFICLFLIVIFQ